MDALAAAADQCLEPVWWLATAGFTTTLDGVLTHIGGVPEPDEAILAARSIVAAVLVPERRKDIRSPEALLVAVLTEARTQLVRRAVVDGRAATLAADHERAQLPDGTPNIDAALAAGEPPEPPPDRHFVRSDDPQTLSFCEEAVAELDERSRRLVELRWREAKTRRETAETFTCGTAAVAAHERRIRRRLQRGLAKAFTGPSFGPAALDRLLCRASGQSSLPLITRERLRADILKRTFQTAPRPYGERLRWGLGAGAFAFALWLLMFFRVVPYYDDDVYPTPSVAVTCDGPCAAGGVANLFVTAPADARFVAFWVSGDRALGARLVSPLLISPYGSVFRLPFGARSAHTRVPYPARWPTGLTGTATVTAIFTAERVSPAALAAIANGTRSGVLTSTTTVNLGT